VGRLAAGWLLERPDRSETIDVVGPSYSSRQLAEALGRGLGKSVRPVEVPPAAHVDSLMKFGAPRSAAEALAELFACTVSGQVTPHGDRIVRSTTTIDDVIARALHR
jgi:nucleoside-diphosphate-sugar epimerase